MVTKQRQADGQQRTVVAAQRCVSRQLELVATVRSLEQTLQQRLQRFTAENAANSTPVQAIFRLDAGFGTWENIALLVELGYEVYTKHGVTVDTAWTQSVVMAMPRRRTSRRWVSLRCVALRSKP